MIALEYERLKNNVCKNCLDLLSNQIQKICSLKTFPNTVFITIYFSVLNEKIQVENYFRLKIRDQVKYYLSQQ